jgi:peroxiredoxin
VELQARYPELEQAGTSVLAISYDPVSVLADFARDHGITYPLLSDEGSHTIRRLGLLNQHVAEQQAYYGRGVEARHEGIPYPGIFFLDEDGVVVDRKFELSYRVRPAPDILLADVVQTGEAASAVSARAGAEGVQLLAWTGSATYRPYQKLHLHLIIQLDEGLHIYAPPARASFTPLTVEVAPIENLVVDPIATPESRPLHVEGFAEEFLVHEGKIAVTVPVHIDANQGDVDLTITVRYQTCTDTTCYPPSALTVALPVRAVDLVRA